MKNLDILLTQDIVLAKAHQNESKFAQIGLPKDH